MAYHSTKAASSGYQMNGLTHTWKKYVCVCRYKKLNDAALSSNVNARPFDRTLSFRSAMSESVTTAVLMQVLYLVDVAPPLLDDEALSGELRVLSEDVP